MGQNVEAHLWYPTHTPTSIEYAGRHGFNFVGLRPAAAVREHTDAYKRAPAGRLSRT
jgi:hypothetical protein